MRCLLAYQQFINTESGNSFQHDKSDTSFLRPIKIRLFIRPKLEVYCMFV